MCPWAWLQLLCWRASSEAWQGQLQARHTGHFCASPSSDISDLVKETRGVSTAGSPGQKRERHPDLRAGSDKERVQLLGLWLPARASLFLGTAGSEVAVGAHRSECAWQHQNKQGRHTVPSKRSWCWMPLT